MRGAKDTLNDFVIMSGLSAIAPPVELDRFQQGMLRMPPSDQLASSVLDLIGNTPLVELSRIAAELEGRIFAKVEFLNPGYSKKDRIALQMIEEAEASGVLQPGAAIVELTSGNTGTGLAIVCAAKGYRFVAVMSRGNSPERAAMMRALGAEVVLVDQCPDSLPGQVSGADLTRVEATAQRDRARAQRLPRRSVPAARQLPRPLPTHRPGDHAAIRRH